MFELVYPVTSVPFLPFPTAESPSTPILDGDEFFPVVEPTGMVTGRSQRTYCHDGKCFLLHPVVHLHVINRRAELYLQKRGAHKDLYPLRWDTAVGGHVAYGEYLSEALFREASEELKFYDFNPVYIQTYVFESQREKELVNIFAAVGDFELTPDEDELACGRFWPMKEIEENLGKSVFTPNFESEFLKIRTSLESLL